MVNQLQLFGQNFRNIYPQGEIYTTTPTFSWDYDWKYSIGDNINGNIVTNRYVEFRFMMSTVPGGYNAEYMIYNTLSSPSYSNDGGINMVGAMTLTYPLNVFGIPEGPDLTVGHTYYCLLFAKEVEYDNNYNIINENGHYANEFTIHIGTKQQVVLIDIRPGSNSNPININSKGSLPVAILGQNNFDVKTIDNESLRFGPNKIIASKYAFEDCNNDRILDLLLHYDLQKIGVSMNTTNLELYGKTKNQLEIIGQDQITIVGNLKKEYDSHGDGINYNYELGQNYPNPFNPSTLISYKVRENCFVTLKVYDLLGNEISSIVNENKSAGSYQVVFSASKLASGVYYYQLRAGSFIETKKFILAK